MYRFFELMFELMDEHPVIASIILIALVVIAIVVYCKKKEKYDVAVEQGDEEGIKSYNRYFKRSMIATAIIVVIAAIVITILLNE